MITHQIFRKQAFYFLLLILWSCSPRTHQTVGNSSANELLVHQMQRITAENISVNDRSPDRDTVIENMITPYKEELDAQMNEIIASIEKTLNKSRADNTLGNWLADEVYTYLQEHDYEVDLSMLNYGGIRLNNLPKGDVTVGKIYELLPFENYIVIMELDAKQIRDLFTHVTNEGGWPISKDWQITYDEEGISSIRYKGQELANDAVIKVALPDYVANGGSDTSVLIGLPQENTKILLRDAIIDALKSEGKPTISVESDKRIIKNE